VLDLIGERRVKPGATGIELDPARHFASPYRRASLSRTGTAWVPAILKLYSAGHRCHNTALPVRDVMKLLFDFFPLLLFFAAYKFYDIFVATAAAILASFAQVTLFWLKHRRFEKMHLIGLGVIVVFGGLTLVLHDNTFIKWKPTIVHWVMAALLIGSHFVGEKTAIERLLGEQISLPQRLWGRLNFSWGVFFFLLGALNIYVAFFFGLHLDTQTRDDIWVYFKVPGTLALTLLFVVMQALLMAKHVQEKAENPES
jgi:intracellular septation protein